MLQTRSHTRGGISGKCSPLSADHILSLRFAAASNPPTQKLRPSAAFHVPNRLRRRRSAQFGPRHLGVPVGKAFSVFLADKA